MPGAKCLNEGTVTLVAGILNCISDLLVTILPIPIIMSLRMPLRQKLGVTSLLSLGFVVTIAGVVRTYYIWKTLLDTYDETWDSMPLYICATVEIDLAVLCACAPALKPLFKPFVTEVKEMITSVGERNGAARSRRQAETDIPTHSNTNTQGNKIPMAYITFQDEETGEAEAERQRRLQHGLCVRCGGNEHQADVCTAEGPILPADIPLED